jgi:hypothetical protein
MTLSEIKNAVDAGLTVHWSNGLYRVLKDKVGQYLILCDQNDYCIGLTWKDGVTLNGKESDFYIEASEAIS